MVAGSKAESGDAMPISSKLRSAVKSIKEVVGDHSESDIYAALRETNMDPDEAAQKLLNQDPFHEVKRRRERKKENNGADDTRVQQEVRTEWKKPDRSFDRTLQSDRSFDRNGRVGRGGYTRPVRGGYSRPTLPGPVKEFRVVRDNRIKQKDDDEEDVVTPANGQTSSLYDGKVATDDVDKRSKEESTNQNLSPRPATSTPSAANNDSSKLNSQNSLENRAEICSSADPIHINVGMRRREVGVVGLRKHNAVYDSRNMNLVSNGGNNRSYTNESSHRYHHGRPNSRGNRPPQQSTASHQKAQQPNMEWRPKSSQSSSRVNDSLTTKQNATTEVDILSENLAKSNVSEDQHVIIPEHLRVPDTEKTNLVFGSFDAVKGAKETDNQPSLGALEPPPNAMVNSEIEQTEVNQVHLAADPNLQRLSDEVPQSIPNHASENVSQYESTLPHDLQENTPDIPNFQEYDPHSRYDMQFLSSVGGGGGVTSEDVTVISTEAMGSPAASSSQILFTHPVTVQQLHQNAVQIQQHQQQQLPQMYPQQMYPNYMPYRHIFPPPMYVPPPQMAVQNYSNNYSNMSNNNTAAYPPHGNSYLVMPASSPTQVTAANGLKYSANQYKPSYTGNNGYGNYTNPGNGYPVTPGVIGPVGTFDDSNRAKFKDNNLYMPSQQVEASDIWVQNPRELPNMPSGPFYNVPAQPATAHATAYLPTHNGSATFNAAPQPSHMQYHHHNMVPAPPPHNMVHQQVTPSGLGPNINMGAGAFQQNHHQLGPIGWTTAANF